MNEESDEILTDHHDTTFYVPTILKMLFFFFLELNLEIVKTKIIDFDINKLLIFLIKSNYSFTLTCIHQMNVNSVVFKRGSYQQLLTFTSTCFF